jgi:hypothetical protein
MDWVDSPEAENLIGDEMVLNQPDKEKKFASRTFVNSIV